MTKIDFTPATQLDIAALERDARALRAQYLRKLFSAGFARLSGLFRGAAEPQA